MTVDRSLPSLLAAALLALAACSTAAPPAEPPASAAAPASGAWAQASALIGDAACTDNAQCRTVGWGAKACGGPAHWVAYSSARTDGAALEQLAKEHAERQRAAQVKSGVVSNCMVVPDPGAQCVASRCVLRNRGNAVAQ